MRVFSLVGKITASLSYTIFTFLLMQQQIKYLIR